MSDEAVVPAGLTTDGLLGRRYMARFIDSTLLGIAILAVLRLAIVPSERFSLIGFLLLMVLWIWLRRRARIVAVAGHPW